MPEFAIKPFCRNQLKSLFTFCSRTLIIPLSLANKYREWCHQHSFQNLDYNSNTKRFAINIINKRDPQIEPWVTPNNILKYSLKVKPIFIFCFLFLWYAEIKTIDFTSKTYALSFAISSWWGMQSKAFESQWGQQQKLLFYM